jgi:YVTN family beta-propeller protein
VKTAIAALALIAAGCSMLTPRVRRAPLENEGEVLVYLEPWPQEAGRLGFEVASLAAVHADGPPLALELKLTDLPGTEATRQRLFARGRLPPGSYRGLDVAVGRATLVGPEGQTQLLVGKEPTAIAGGFEVRKGRVTVLSLALQYDASVQAAYAFSPRFHMTIPARPMPQLYGLAANEGDGDLTLFDKRRRTVFSVVSAGREPQGVAFGPVPGRLYVALSGEDQVAVLDAITTEPLPSILLAAGDRPRELAVSPDGRLLLVLNHGSNSLAFVDPAAGREIGRVATGQAPTSLLVDRSFRRAYVLNQGSSTLTVVDIATRTVAGSTGTDPLPVRAQLNRAGDRLYLIHAGSSQMNVYSLPDLRLLNRLNVGLGASALKIDPRSDLIYLAKRDDRRLYVYDAFSLIPVDFFDVEAGVTWLAIDDNENTLLALMPGPRAVAVVDLASRRQVGTALVGDDPYMVAVAGERF